MLDYLFLPNSGATGAMDLLVLVLIATLLGCLLAFTLRKTYVPQKAMPALFPALTIAFAPLMAVCMGALQHDIARAVIIAAVVYGLRKRPVMIISAAVGILCGIGLPGYAIILGVGLVAASLVNGAQMKKHPPKQPSKLVITVPEELRIPGAFEGVLSKFATSYTMTGIRTVEMGMFLEVTYMLTLPEETDSKAFLNALRGLNGNLSVSLVLSGGPPDQASSEF